jgi:hypothetical protein
MSIRARYPERNFTPCPEGFHHAVCCDVVDLGEVDTDFGRKWRVRLVWQINKTDPARGRRFDAVKTFTNSLHPRANLRADLEMWRGRKFTEGEAKDFDLERLIGANAMIEVQHNTSESGDTYANVRAIEPVQADAPRLTPLNYVRAKDRTKPNGGAPAAPTTATASRDEDNVPF